MNHAIPLWRNGSVLSILQYRLVQLITNILTFLIVVIVTRNRFWVLLEQQLLGASQKVKFKIGREIVKGIGLPLSKPGDVPSVLDMGVWFAGVLVIIMFIITLSDYVTMFVSVSYTSVLATGSIKYIGFIVPWLLVIIWYVSLRKRLRDANIKPWLAIFPALFAPTFGLVVMMGLYTNPFVRYGMWVYVLVAGYYAFGAAWNHADLKTQLDRERNYRDKQDTRQSISNLHKTK